jgi:hypothetical protein
VTPDLDTINSFNICTADSNQAMVDIAYGASLYFVTWSDNRSGCFNTYGARVTLEGNVLDTNGFMIGPPSNAKQWQPSVVFADSQFFVIWGYDENPGRITGRFVSLSGIPMDDTIPIALTNGSVDITREAFDGTSFFIAWTEFDQAIGWSKARGQLITRTGVPAGTSFIIADSVYSDRSLGLKFEGSHYLVTFSKQAAGVLQVFGSFYDTPGQMISSICRISNSADNCIFCDITTSGNGNYLSVWTQNLGNYDIYGNVDLEFCVYEHDIMKRNDIIS